jgi:transcriptional regulator with XRE-family HTH domain
MREKLLKLMESEKLTASRLAELLGIRSSGISHIISERNKPSYDLLQKILRRFPNINPDWLLLDSDQMYRTDIPSTVASSGNHSSEGLDIFSAHDEVSKSLNSETGYNNPTQNGGVSSGENFDKTEFVSQATSRRGVKRIIVLYDDNTFESYNPR